VEQYTNDVAEQGRDAQEALGPIIQLALSLSKLQEFTGRDKPTVIT
jgi:phosphoglucomutase